MSIEVEKLNDPSNLDNFIFNKNNWRQTVIFSSWFINARWLFIFVFLFFIIITQSIGGVLPTDTQLPLKFILCVMIVTNLLFLNIHSKEKSRNSNILVWQFNFDLIVLTSILHYTGGIENPFFVVYIFHVIFGSIIFEKKLALLLVLFGCLLFGILITLELFDVIEHYSVSLTPHLKGDEEHLAHVPLYVYGRYLPWAVVSLGAFYFTTTIMGVIEKREFELEQAWHKSLLEEKKLSTVIDATGAGVALFDEKNQFVWCNKRTKSWFPKIEMENRFVWSEKCTFGFSCGENCLLNIPSGTDNQTKTFERKWISNEEVFYHFQITVSYLDYLESKSTYKFLFIQDVTKRKALDAKILHIEKMSTLGQLTASIAHEIGNPLASTLTRFQLMKENRNFEFWEKSIDVLEQQSFRILKIVRNISKFSKVSSSEWGACKINEIIIETLNVIEVNLIKNEIKLINNLNENIPIVIGEKDQLIQVFMNLLINANDAIGNNGVVTIGNHFTSNWMYINISDTGGGISESHLKKIFLPFFSTKRSGTGLGLAICQNIIKAHGGEILIVDNSSKGVTFSVKLPRISTESFKKDKF